MTLLKLFELEDTEQEHAVSTLSEGEHVLGRDLLKCEDKRVSRKHAVINVKEESVTIKSIHLNPCFFKAASGQCIEILQKENSIGLNDGDQFGLLADKFWFKVKVIVDKNNGLSVPQTSSKRTHTDQNDEQEETIKRQRVSESNDPTASTSPKSKSPSLDGLLDSALNTTHNDEGNINANLLINNLESIVEEDYGNKNSDKKENGSADSDSDKSMDLLEPVKTEKPDGSVPIKAEETKPENDPQEGVNSSNDVKKEKVENAESEKVADSSAQTDPSTSTSDPAKNKTKRDRCWYGASCYRKNPVHRTDFSHPGDNDYDSDPDDDRPECPFGASCYRTNSDHRKQYKHKYQLAPKPKDTQPKKNKSPRVDDSDSGENDSSSSSEDGKDVGNGRRTKRKAALKKTKYAETPEDDYDLDDSFINDASSDEFKLSVDDSGDTSTDWDDSQKVDEDSIETRRLLKEAKKFTKQKEKKKDK